ncbi:MAG: hypothetical protein HRF40_00430 [Nitrososphaera sp.]
MRRSFVMLAAGGGLLVAGFVIMIATAVSLLQVGAQNAFFEALVDVRPNGQESFTFDIRNASQPFYITASRTDENQLIPPAVVVEGQVVDPEGATILTDPDIIQGIARVEPTVAGTYTLYLTNTHRDEGVRLYIALTSGFFPTTQTETLAIVGWATAGLFVMIAGALVSAVGAVLFFTERRRSKNKGTSFVT